ncbi:hypothetical protein TNCT_328591 [Trichonephila clavata]|uniref:Uncharacterized protein n=1 Tax=Trichonephila clavata TaxID=2740835 RepID=A0A8X6KTW3_TRICU|nr:hypothetical protein TNCT_328591 [Trichonephila clavata]
MRNVFIKITFTTIIMFLLFISVVPEAEKLTEFEFQDTESHPSQSSRRSETSITINSSETSLPTDLGDPTNNYSMRIEDYTTKVVNEKTTSFLYVIVSKVPFTAERTKHKRNTSLPVELRDLASNDAIDFKDQVAETLIEQEMSVPYEEFNNKDEFVSEKTKRSLRQKLYRRTKQKKNPNYLRRQDTFTKTNLFRRKSNKKVHKSTMDRNKLKNLQQMNPSEKFPFPLLKNLMSKRNLMHPTLAKKLHEPDKNKFEKEVTEAEYLLVDDRSTFSIETREKTYDSESTLDSDEPDSEAETKVPSEETEQFQNDYLNSTDSSSAEIEPQQGSFDESASDNSITWSESIDSLIYTQSAQKVDQKSVRKQTKDSNRIKIANRRMDQITKNSNLNNHLHKVVRKPIHFKTTLKPTKPQTRDYLDEKLGEFSTETHEKRHQTFDESLDDNGFETGRKEGTEFLPGRRKEAETVYLNTPDSLTAGTVSQYPDYYENEDQTSKALTSYDSNALSEGISKKDFSLNTSEIKSLTETDDAQKINDVTDIYNNTTDFILDYEETQLKIKRKEIETEMGYNRDTNLNVDSLMPNITEPYQLTDDDEIYSREITLIKMELQYEDTSQESNEHNMTSIYDKSTVVEKEDSEEIYTDDTSEINTSTSEAFPVSKSVNNRQRNSYRNKIYNVNSSPTHLKATRRKTAKPYINFGKKSRGRLNKYHQKASKRKYSTKSSGTTSRSKYVKKSHQGISVMLPTKSTNKTPHKSISASPKTRNKKLNKVIVVKDPQKYLKSISHRAMLRKPHKNADLKKPRLYLVAVRPKLNHRKHHNYGETNRRKYLNAFHKKNENKAWRVWESSTQNKVLLVKPDHFRKKWKPTRPRGRGGYYKNRQYHPKKVELSTRCFRNLFDVLRNALKYLNVGKKFVLENKYGGSNLLEIEKRDDQHAESYSSRSILIILVTVFFLIFLLLSFLYYAGGRGYIPMKLVFAKSEVTVFDGKDNAMFYRFDSGNPFKNIVRKLCCSYFESDISETEALQRHVPTRVDEHHRKEATPKLVRRVSKAPQMRKVKKVLTECKILGICKEQQYRENFKRSGIPLSPLIQKESSEVAEQKEKVVTPSPYRSEAGVPFDIDLNVDQRNELVHTILNEKALRDRKLVRARVLCNRIATEHTPTYAVPSDDATSRNLLKDVMRCIRKAERDIGIPKPLSKQQLERSEVNLKYLRNEKP